VFHPIKIYRRHRNLKAGVPSAFRALFGLCIVGVLGYVWLWLYANLMHGWISPVVSGLVFTSVGWLYGIDPIIEAIPNLFPKEKTTAPGSARWAGFKDFRKLLKPARNGLIIGWFRDKPLRYTGDAHFVCYGGSRKGKDSGLIVPWVLDNDNPMFIFDPRAEVASITWERRAKDGPCMAINPFALLVNRLPYLKGKPINPMGFMPADLWHPGAMNMSRGISAGLMRETPENPFWCDSGIEFLTALFMEGRHRIGPVCQPGHVRNWLAKAVGKDENGKPLGLLRLIQEIADGDGPAAAKMGPYCNLNDTTSAVLTTLTTDTGCLDQVELQAAMDGPSFDWTRLFHERWTIYFIMPVQQMTYCAPWVRMFLGWMLYDLMQPGAGGKYKPDLILNEAHLFGGSRQLREAYAFGALWFRCSTFWQNEGQVKRLYGDPGEFTSNAGGMACLSPGFDVTGTAKTIAELCGKKTESIRSYSTNMADGEKATEGVSESPQAHCLIHPDEVTGLLPRQIIAFDERVGRPIRTYAHPYWDTPIKGFDHGCKPNLAREHRAEPGTAVAVVNPQQWADRRWLPATIGNMPRLAATKAIAYAKKASPIKVVRQ
jgi:type IV secretory pathway TraG/TraD family ATPase VirD4